MKNADNNVGNHPLQCYGCSSCEFICPKNAICLKSDTKGFLYPQIDKDICIDCGLCKSVCPINKENIFKNKRAEKCYAIKNRDEIRIESSSGGVYTALTDQILKLGGACVGVIYNDELQVIYEIAYTPEERNLQRESKYVQSYMFPKVLNDLLEIIQTGRYVLVSGTPCQIAGIKSLLIKKNIETDRVIFLDIVCHGTPSPKVWKDYLSELEKKHNSKAKSFTFRDKKKGWRGYHVRIELENGTILEETNETDSYISIFKENLTLRESCFSCPYASMNRCGDITIGDFWGIEEVDSTFSDNNGISMVIANSEKGKRFLSTVISNLRYKEYSSRVVTQHNMHMPSEHGVTHKRFWRIYKRKGYKGISTRFAKGGSLYVIYHLQLAIKLRLAQIKRQFL